MIYLPTTGFCRVDAIIQSIHSSFLRASNFHLGQAWYRHIQADTDLRKTCMDSKSDGGKWLRSFFGLAYLPPDEVYEGFTDILETALIEAEDFLEYLLQNYIRDDAKYPPSM